MAVSFESTYFLIFLFITCTRCLEPARALQNSSRAVSSTVKISEYDEFQIIMDVARPPQTKQVKLFHGPLTTVNLSSNRIKEADLGKEKTVKRSKSVVERRKNPEGFPPGTEKTRGTHTTSKTIPSLADRQILNLKDHNPALHSIQYSSQVLRHLSRRKRTPNTSSHKNHHQPLSHTPNNSKDRHKSIPDTKVLLSSHSSHPTHYPNHQNTLHKRAATISPALLFLKIFMDYSSPNEEETTLGGSTNGNLGQSNSSVTPTNSRHRYHRSSRTSLSSGNRTEAGVTTNMDDEVHMTLLMKPQGNSSLLELSGKEENNETNGTDSFPRPHKCMSSLSSCPEGFFACKTNSILCLPQSAICNGKADCPDGSDEDKDCVNIHEKNFWDNYFRKRPSADVNEETVNGNASCLYTDVLSRRTRGKSGVQVEKEDQQRLQEFRGMLANRTCKCTREKVLCQNVHLTNLHIFPEDIQFLDLSGSRIEILDFPRGRFHRLKTLVLASCSINEISADTFSSLPNLKDLHLSGNRLKRIPAAAFSGSGNLSKLFLGHNRLEALDSESFHGLFSLEYLDLRKNRLTGEDSNVYHALGSLRTLHLSYNEIRLISKDYLKGLLKLDMLSLSKNKIAMVANGAFNHTPVLRHLHLSYNRLSVLENNMFSSLPDLQNLNLNDNGIATIEPLAFDDLCSLQSLLLQKNPFRELTDDDGDINSPRELFKNLINLKHIYFDEWWMCWWAPHVRSCEPKGDGISSVENLLDNFILRICVWIMGLVGVGGNVFVIISRLMIREKNRAHSFYIKNLAVADLLMGLFLISIGIHDQIFRGHFLAHQHVWRHSFTCQFFGILSTLSSEASVLILFLITLDRYLSIVRPFAERTNALIPAILICGLLWAISIFLSSAPVWTLFEDYFGQTFYTSNGLCLPLHIHNPYETGWEYSLFLFIVINAIAFVFICYAYWKMLRIIQTSTTSIRSTQQKQDGMLAKRFGLVVLTDFLCWAPIIVFKCVAMAGVQIQPDLYAWLAVFVLPVNSALNPVIYTLSTKLFKQQVSHFTVGFRKRLGLAADDSMTSSLRYRNRISRTLQTSLNSSMFSSTRRHHGDSTRVTVLRDRMAMANRMSSKVGSYSPPTGAVTTSPVVVSGGQSTTCPISTTGKDNAIPNGKGTCPETSNSKHNTPTHTKTEKSTGTIAILNEDQISMEQPLLNNQDKAEESDKKEVKVLPVVEESEL